MNLANGAHRYREFEAVKQEKSKSKQGGFDSMDQGMERLNAKNV